MVGLGSDVVRVSRIQRAWERYGNRFAERILTTDEAENWWSRGYSVHFLACRWAAKEATAKALGTGFRGGISWHDIRVANNSLGAPVLTLAGAASKRLQALGGCEGLLSLSDDGDYAFAVVILQ